MVYVEQVEAGATRLVAVFASRQPGTVGPVRSVRNNDPELLAAYGRPALAYSGGAAGPAAGCTGPGWSTPARATAARARRLPPAAPTTWWWTSPGCRERAARRRAEARASAAGDPRLAAARRSAGSRLVGKTRYRFAWEARGSAGWC